MKDDAELLRAYAENRSETAFAEFVGRRIGFVYATALRVLAGNTHSAQDVTQAVFVLVASKPAALARHGRPAGWLHATTCNLSRKLVREACRRASREQEAARMSEIENDNNNSSGGGGGAGLETHAPDMAPGTLRPMLDEVLGALRASDREAVLLRFFEGLPFAAIGAKLSMPEDAARMRVTRAVEKMRAAFAKRGVTSSAAALGALMIAEAAQVPPAGLAASVSAGAMAMATAGAAATAAPAGAGAIPAFLGSAKMAAAVVAALLITAGGVYYGVRNARATPDTPEAPADSSRQRQRRDGASRDGDSRAPRDSRAQPRDDRQSRASFLVDLSAFSFPDPAASSLPSPAAMQAAGPTSPSVPGLPPPPTLDPQAWQAAAGVQNNLSLPLPFLARTRPALEQPLPFDGSGITAITEQLQQQLKRLAQPQHVTAATRPVSDAWTRTFLPVGLHSNPQVDYAIVTEMTDAGRGLSPPSFDKPVYYIAHSMGQQDVGDAYGFTKDIPYQQLQDKLTDALASNGYLPADPEHPDPGKIPTQVLFFAWGMHNKMDAAFATPHAMSMEAHLNTLSRAKTVGGQKFADEYAAALAACILDKSDFAMRSFANRDETTETLVYAISNECYYLIVTAYDLEALRKKQRNPLPLLWVTRVSTVSRGISFERTLPIMVNNASYFFGRETPPEILRKRAYKNPKVEIDDPTVVEYIPAAAAPAASGTTTPAAR